MKIFAIIMCALLVIMLGIHFLSDPGEALNAPQALYSQVDSLDNPVSPVTPDATLSAGAGDQPVLEQELGSQRTYLVTAVYEFDPLPVPTQPGYRPENSVTFEVKHYRQPGLATLKRRALREGARDCALRISAISRLN